MPNKVLIDTNILIDTIDSNRPYHPDAIRLFQFDGVEICVIVSSLKDTYYILNRIYHDERRAREDIRTIMDATTVLDITAASARDAIDSSEPDFEDSIVRSVAEMAHVDYLLTRDTHAFIECAIPRMTVGEYLELVSRNHKQG